MPLWIPVSRNGSQRAAQTLNFAGPLTNSYPAGPLYVTATSAKNLAPGQPTSMTRVFAPNPRNDPRSASSGGFFNLNAGNDLSSLIAGAQPVTNNSGGSNINLAPNGDYSPLIMAIAAIGLIICFFK